MRRRADLRETFSFELTNPSWFLTVGQALTHVTYASTASFDNATKAFEMQSSFIFVPYKKGDDPKMNCASKTPEPVTPSPGPAPAPAPGPSPEAKPPGKPGEIC